MMRSLSTKDFSAVLLGLYRVSERLPPERYQDWALDQLRPYVPFDMGAWTSGYIEGARLHACHVHSVNLPREMLDQYDAVRHLDALAIKAVQEPGSAVTSSLREAGKNPGFRSFAKRWQLAQGLAFVAVDPLTSLATGLTLYREPARPPFSDRERLFFESIAAHLIENHAATAISHLLHVTHLTDAGIVSSGIADRFANLQVALPDFQRLLLLEWSGWRERSLPVAIRHLTDGASASPYVGERIVVKVSRMNDVFLLQAREKQAADSLSEREHDVASLLAGGLTHKEAAQRLGVTPSTVRNHLSSIFAKLRVNKQSEMAAALHILR